MRNFGINSCSAGDCVPPATAGVTPRDGPSRSMHPLPRIAHVIHSGAVGGGPRIVLDLATRAPGQHVVISADDGPLLTDARGAGLETRILPYAGEFSFSR